MMHIYERIKKAREDAGLTPEALADKLGIPRTTYLHWETSTPKPEKVMSIARALDLPEYYFFLPENITPSMIQKLSIDENIDKESKKLEAEQNQPDVIIGSKEGQLIFVQAKDLTASYERIIEAKDETIIEKEARRLEAAEWAKRAESEKKDLFEMFKDYLKEILANSRKSKEAIQNLRTEIIAENGEMMATLDQIAGNAPGTTAAKAGTLELAHRVHKAKKGKSSSAAADKTDK